MSYMASTQSSRNSMVVRGAAATTSATVSASAFTPKSRKATTLLQAMVRNEKASKSGTSIQEALSTGDRQLSPQRLRPSMSFPEEMRKQANDLGDRNQGLKKAATSTLLAKHDQILQSMTAVEKNGQSGKLKTAYINETSRPGFRTDEPEAEAVPRNSILKRSSTMEAGRSNPRLSRMQTAPEDTADEASRRNPRLQRMQTAPQITHPSQYTEKVERQQPPMSRIPHATNTTKHSLSLHDLRDCGQSLKSDSLKAKDFASPGVEQLSASTTCCDGRDSQEQIMQSRSAKSARAVAPTAQTSNLIKEKNQLADGTVRGLRKGSMSARTHSNEADAEAYTSFLCQPVGGAKAAAAKRTATPASARKAAFTDRSLRMREGAYVRDNILGQDFGLGEKAQQGHTLSCNCPVCKPFSLGPAGASSGMISNNGSSLVAMNANQDHDRSSHTFDSSDLGNLMYAQNEQHFASAAPLTHSEFIKEVGAHGRGGPRTPKPPRSFSEEPRSAGSQRFGGFMIGEEGQPSLLRRKPSAKCGVGMVLNPEDSDPPLNTALTTSGTKAPGQFKGGLSSLSARQAQHWNPTLYKMEAFAVEDLDRSEVGLPPLDRASKRSQSMPPLRDSMCNVITHDGFDEGSMDKKAIKRSGIGNISTAFADTVNFDRVARQQVHERESRMQNDLGFASLCQVTSIMASNHAVVADKNKAKNSNNSRLMAASLRWPAAGN